MLLVSYYWLKTQHSKNRPWPSVPSLHGKNMGEKNRNNDRLYFLGSKITVDSEYSHNLKAACSLEKKL